MKILFLITSLHDGGAERVLSNMSQNFPDDVKCEVLLNKCFANDYPFKGEIIELGIEEDFSKSVCFQVKMLISRLKMLHKLKKYGNYSACISFMDSANVANVLSGSKYCKVIVTMHTSYNGVREKIYKWFVIPMVGFIYRFADLLVPVSELMKKELIEDMHIKPDKIQVINNAFNIKDILKSMQDPIEDAELIKFVEDSFVYVNMGRLEKPKGQIHLIRAFSFIKESCENVKLLIMGSGSEKEYLESAINELELNGYIKILPFQKNPHKVLAVCHAFIFPSLWEGYPNALCEALICGLPCIGADCKSGVREILAPNTDIEYQNIAEMEYAEYGILVPTCSGKRYASKDALEKEEIILSDAMKQFREDRELYRRYKDRAIKRAAQLDIKPCIDQWMDAIKNSN